MGARESLNGRKNKARRKVKNGEKSPWGQCLTRPVPNGRRWTSFSGTSQKPEQRRPFGTGLVRHCPQGLFWPFFTFLLCIFFRPLRLSLAPTITHSSCCYKSVYKNCFIIIILIFFHNNYFNFFMFRDVPGCSGIFRNVPCSWFYQWTPNI